MRYINALIYSDNVFIRIGRHVLFWMTDIANWLIVVSASGIDPREKYFFFLSMPFVMGATYTIIYGVLPKFYVGREKSKLFFQIAAILVLLTVCLRVYKYYILLPALAPEKQTGFDLWNVAFLIRELFRWLSVISIAIVIKLVKSKTELEESNAQLLNEKKTAELNFLKAQMHPHFLFNTLNTLYSETLQNSGNAGRLVLQLSNLLRFILEECNKPLIPVEKEIKVIRDYVDLEKLRHGSRLQVDMAIMEHIPKLYISPLILLPFIENSFKHSLNNITGLVRISISVEVTGSRLHLTVANDHFKNTKSVNGHAPGKGVANIKKQLELIYEKNYSLDIEESVNLYKVALTLPMVQNGTNE
jgi:two-component system, LytTR family, sensor kinase